MKEFKGRIVASGTVTAKALVSHGGLNTLASFQKALQFGDKKATCGDQNNPDLYGKQMAGKALCLPTTIGSTTGGLVLYCACSMNRQPACMLFSEPIEIELSTGNLTSCPHRFTQYLREYNSFPDMNRNQEVFNTGMFSVDDVLLGEKNTVDISFFNAVRSGSGLSTIPGSNSQLFKHLVAMYTGLNDADTDLRLLVDFFYHYQLQRGIIKEASHKRLSYYSRNDDFEFSEEMKSALVRIAKIVVSVEINHYISTIRPTIDSKTLEPEWRLNSLLEAIYFSIFYMKPGIEIYKECQNPSCKREVYFLVNATATNKKYCCPACANAAAQRRSRERKMNK